jgi:hypothetical protein
VARALAGDDADGPGQPKQVTIVTNAINIASELTVRRRIKLVVTGGVSRLHSFELTGPLGPDWGAKVADDEAHINRLMAERAHGHHRGRQQQGERARLRAGLPARRSRGGRHVRRGNRGGRARRGGRQLARHAAARRGARHGADRAAARRGPRIYLAPARTAITRAVAECQRAVSGPPPAMAAAS